MLQGVWGRRAARGGRGQRHGRGRGQGQGQGRGRSAPSGLHVSGKPSTYSSQVRCSPPRARTLYIVTGFDVFEPIIRRFGGIASRCELLAVGRAAGWTETDFRFAQIYGHLDRIRPGWYASHDLPADARAGWRAGGPLACVSALAHYGLLTPPRNSDDALLHICLPGDGRLPHGAPADLVVHWSTADRHSGTRRAVDPLVAAHQARTCSAALRELVHGEQIGS